MNFGDKRIYCLCIAVVLTVTVSAVVLKNICFSIKAVTCSLDPLLNATVSNDLKKQITQDLITPRNLKCYVQELKEQYPFINKIQITLPTAQRAHITVSTVYPLFCVNKQHVLLTNGLLVNRNIYNEEITKSLYAIQLIPSQVDSTVLRWLMRQNFAVMNAFTISIKSPHEIVLQTLDTHDQIICSTDLIITDQIITQALNLCHEHRQQTVAKKLQDGWICDLRFAGQIVLYKNKGKGSV